MQLTELVGVPAQTADGTVTGTVIDVRLSVTGDVSDHPAPPTVYGLIISPRTASSYLGYERSEAAKPALLAAVLRCRHRGTFLVLWRDIAQVTPDGIHLRDGFARYSAVLRVTPVKTRLFGRQRDVRQRPESTARRR